MVRVWDYQSMCLSILKVPFPKKSLTVEVSVVVQAVKGFDSMTIGRSQHPRPPKTQSSFLERNLFPSWSARLRSR